MPDDTDQPLIDDEPEIHDATSFATSENPDNVLRQDRLSDPSSAFGSIHPIHSIHQKFTIVLTGTGDPEHVASAVPLIKELLEEDGNASIAAPSLTFGDPITAASVRTVTSQYLVPGR